jgi:hypothetical protein
MMTTVWAGRGIDRITLPSVEASPPPTATEAAVGSPIEATARTAATSPTGFTRLTLSGVAAAKTRHPDREEHDDPPDHDG